MEYRRLGNTDMNVSVLGFGGAEIGWQHSTVNEVDILLGRALDVGCNVIDTAECYNNSEELIGKSISHRRNDYYLFTKCGHSNGFNYKDWDPRLIEKSIDRSLKRLNTDYLDCVLLHTTPEDVLREGKVIEALKNAKKKGKTRYIGYSGDSSAALYAVKLKAFDCLETSVNIVDQEAISLTLPKAKDAGMGVIAKRPIANVVWNYNSLPEDETIQDYWKRIKELDYNFVHQFSDSVRQALRFTVSVPEVHVAIVGTTKPERWIQNASIINEGLLEEKIYEYIRNKWLEISRANWIGKT